MWMKSSHGSLGSVSTESTSGCKLPESKKSGRYTPTLMVSSAILVGRVVWLPRRAIACVPDGTPACFSGGILSDSSPRGAGAKTLASKNPAGTPASLDSTTEISGGYCRGWVPVPTSSSEPDQSAAWPVALRGELLWRPALVLIPSR